MARTSTNDHSSAAGDNSLHSSLLDQSHDLTTAQNIVISPMGLSEVPVPGNAFISQAVMTQEGSDLILESPDGITMVIEGYFSSDTPPNLISSDGKVMTPALVKSFIQASTDFAEDKTAMNDATPVGEAHEVTGHATVKHMDGTTETITKGTHIFEGDVIETDAKGAVNVQFSDESSFAVSGNAKMAIDEFVFDTATNGGENKFSVLRGLFVYTSGLVGREDPDDVHINTPVGSIGIRGTIITGDIPADGDHRPASISVVEGAIVINSVTGGPEIILSKQFETVHINTEAGTAENVGVMLQGDMSETFNVLRTVAPTLFSTIEEATPQDAVPVEVAPDGALPAPEDAAPVETQEQPVEPEAVTPDAPIQLNLMNDRLDPLLEDKARTLANDTTLEKLALFSSHDSGSTLQLGAMPIAAPAAPESTPPVSAGEQQPEAPPPILVEQADPPPGVDPGGNTAPTLVGSGYHESIQQGLLVGRESSLYMNQFFHDAETNNSLVYTVTPSSGFIAGTTYNINTLNGLLNVTSGALMGAGSQTMEFIVTASDGEFTSPSMTVRFTVYAPTVTGTESVDNPLDSIADGDVISGLGGADVISLYDNNVVAFGSNGADTMNMYGNNGRAFGDTGADTIIISGGTGNVASGGLDNDQIAVSLNSGNDTFKAFGGRGNDKITLNNVDAFNSLKNGYSLVDGGEGTDSIKFSASAFNGALDIGQIANQLHSIERAHIAGANASVTLGLGDIIKMSGDNHKFFISLQSTNTLQIDADGNGALTALGAGTDVTRNDGDGSITYHAYSNGNITLYISDAHGAISGTGIVP